MRNSQRGLWRPEDELVLRCARVQLRPADAQRIAELLGADLDWTYLLPQANRQAVVPLLAHHLLSSHGDALPSAWADVLRQCQQGRVRHNLNLTAELLCILERLREHGIRAVPYKGPVLAAALYGNLALREFSDLDIIVRHRDIPAALDTLVASGYQPQFHLEHVRRHPDQAPGQYEFTRPGSKLLVELHSDRTLRYFPVPPDLEAIWKRLQGVELGGRVVQTLGPGDLLVFLCVHGAKHFWQRLAWICDVAELAGRASLRWPDVFEQARRLDAERMVLLGLSLARDLLGARLAEEVEARLRSDRTLPAMGAEVESMLFAVSPRAPGLWTRFRFRARMRSNSWDGVRYCLRLATTPTDEDWSAAGLPRRLSPLYALIRPWRLVRNYGLLGRRFPPDPDLGQFEPTPGEVVERMLELAELRTGDVVYDLGSGDGRGVIRAAEKYGASGVGVELDARLIRQARENARRHGVERLVRFVHDDAKRVNLARASVVLLYLPCLANLALRSKLQAELPAGARIVARGAHMGDWSPERTEAVVDSGGTPTTLYLWRIPAGGRASRRVG